MKEGSTYTAFAGHSRIVTGELAMMLTDTKAYLDKGTNERVLIFEDRWGNQIDFDFRGTIEEVLARIPSHPLFRPVQPAETKPPRPGRPKLGVVSKEVTLLPRHWEWLAREPSGISAALRKIIEKEMKVNPDEPRFQDAAGAVNGFMTALAGDLPGYEEATRALFAHDLPRLRRLIAEWPQDIQEHIQRMLQAWKV